MSQTARYEHVLLQLAQGLRVKGSTLNALPRLHTKAPLPADRWFKSRDDARRFSDIREVFSMVIDSAARLAGSPDDSRVDWIMVGLEINTRRVRGFDVYGNPVLRGMLCALGMAADFAGGLDRAGLLPADDEGE